MEKSSSAVQEVAETRRAGRLGRREAGPEGEAVVNGVEVGLDEGKKVAGREAREKTSRRANSCDAEACWRNAHAHTYELTRNVPGVPRRQSVA